MSLVSRKPAPVKLDPSCCQFYKPCWRHPKDCLHASSHRPESLHFKFLSKLRPWV